MNRRDAMKFGLGSLVAALPMGNRAVAAIPAVTGVTPTTELHGHIIIFDHEHHRDAGITFEITPERVGFVRPIARGAREYEPDPAPFPLDLMMELCEHVLNAGARNLGS